jgi:hypothetical protein
MSGSSALTRARYQSFCGGLQPRKFQPSMGDNLSVARNEYAVIRYRDPACAVVVDRLGYNEQVLLKCAVVKRVRRIVD